MKLLVLDGNSLVNRAYFGIKLLTTKDGRYTNAIFGFQNILLNLLSAHHPDAVAIAWDEKAPTFRHTAYDGYKATRHGMPQELAEQASSNFQVRSSGERMARNTPIQGTAADIIKLAMVHVWQRLRDEKLQARLLLQVHDELIVEAPENEVEQVKRILKEEMEQVVSYSVPLTAEVGTGKTWLEAH